MSPTCLNCKLHCDETCDGQAIFDEAECPIERRVREKNRIRRRVR